MLWGDHYAILGVTPTASDEEIEAAYGHLCRRYHPDLNPGDPQALAAYERIESAYEILRDSERRRHYDRRGHRPLPSAPPPAARLTTQTEAEHENGSSFRELFQALRDHRRRARARGGEDLHVPVSIPLAQAELGRRTAVEVRRLVPCRHCDGRGRIGREHSPCGLCQGSGKEIFSKGTLSIACPCADCNGQGNQLGVPCHHCHGSGLSSSLQALAVQIPAGVVDGQVMRQPGGGHHGPLGGPPGDLLITCRVQPQPPFERQGPNLQCEVSISVAEAVLGGRVPVPTLGGDAATLRLPPGTQNGRCFRLRGRGLRMPEGRRGDLLIRVRVWIPALVDEDTKRLIHEFGARTGWPRRLSTERATVNQ